MRNLIKKLFGGVHRLEPKQLELTFTINYTENEILEHILNAVGDYWKPNWNADKRTIIKFRTKRNIIQEEMIKQIEEMSYEVKSGGHTNDYKVLSKKVVLKNGID